MGPPAPLLPQLPQVSQLRVSSTLSSTVAPVGGTGVGVGLGAGLGLGAGVGVGLDVGVGGLVGPGGLDVLLAAVVVLPQEIVISNSKEIAQTLRADHQRRKRPPEENLAWRSGWVTVAASAGSYIAGKT